MHESILLLAQAPGGSAGYANLLLIAGLAVMMYFVMIRPQQKQMAQHRALLASLKKAGKATLHGFGYAGQGLSYVLLLPGLYMWNMTASAVTG